MNDLLLIGSIISIFLFPLGLFLGLIQDKYFKAKLLRSLTKKNYGIINLISRDGKSIISFVQDLNNAMIQIKDSLWVINESRIYNEKAGIKNPIMPDQIKYVGGIPVLFIDFNTFRPLTFWEEKTKEKPEELFAPIKAWVISKEAELLRWKRTTQLMVVLLIVIIGVAVYYSFDTNRIIRELQPIVTNMKELIANMTIPRPPVIVGP